MIAFATRTNSLRQSCGTADGDSGTPPLTSPITDCRRSGCGGVLAQSLFLALPLPSVILKKQMDELQHMLRHSLRRPVFLRESEAQHFRSHHHSSTGTITMWVSRRYYSTDPLWSQICRHQRLQLEFGAASLGRRESLFERC